MLATVLGPGNAVVHASAALDYDQSQTTSRIYDPNKQGPIPVRTGDLAARRTQAPPPARPRGSSGRVPRSPWPLAPARSACATGAATKTVKGATTTKTTTKKTTTKTTKSTSGAGGAAAKTGASGTTSGTTVPSYSQVGSSQQDVVSEVTKSVNSAPGLERLSVAVVVDSSVKGVNANEIKQLVSAAAGLDPSRGDTIQVAFVPFNQSAAQQATAQLKAAASAKSQAAMMSEARGGAVLLVVIGLLAYAMRRITKTARVPLALPAGYGPLELEGGEEDEAGEEMALALTGARTTSVPEPCRGPDPPAERGQPDRPDDRTRAGTIAEMLRAWLETGPGER